MSDAYSFDQVVLGDRRCDAWVHYYQARMGRVLCGSLGLVSAGFGMGPRRTVVGAWLVLRQDQDLAPCPTNQPGARELMRRFLRAGRCRRQHRPRPGRGGAPGRRTGGMCTGSTSGRTGSPRLRSSTPWRIPTPTSTRCPPHRPFATRPGCASRRWASPTPGSRPAAPLGSDPGRGAGSLHRVLLGAARGDRRGGRGGGPGTASACPDRFGRTGSAGGALRLLPDLAAPTARGSRRPLHVGDGRVVGVGASPGAGSPRGWSGATWRENTAAP